jgi:nucleotide-binding universal stress UspA family protein
MMSLRMFLAEAFQLGGVAQKIVKYAPCSVLVSR